MKNQTNKYSRNAVNRISSRAFKANKIRNTFVIISVALTTLMLTCVFSIGFSFAKNLSVMEIREKGSAAQCTIVNPTQNQLQKAQELPYIKAAGTEIKIGTVNVFSHSDSVVNVISIDNSQWEHHLKPCISDISGHLPQQKNEIMLSSRALNLLGIKEPKEGLEVSITVPGHSEQTFTLCGWYTEYSANTNGTALLSEAYCEANGLTVSKDGAIKLSVKNGEKDIVFRIMQDFQPSEQQMWFMNIRENKQPELSPIAVIGISLLIFLIVFSGYLLITNILNISIAQDIRFYGLLKTLGAQKKQIGGIVRKQVLMLSCIGIPIGLLIGVFACFGIVPFAMRIVSSGSNSSYPTEVSFQPLIFIGSVIFALITSLLGCRKPAKIAQQVSPVTALNRILSYKENNSSKASRKQNGCKLKNMAWKNVFRDHKRAVLVFTSVSLSIALFLSVNAVANAVGGESYFNAKYPYDFVCAVQNSKNSEIVNLTGAPVVPDDETANQFSMTPKKIQNIIDEVKKTDGITQVDIIRSTKCDMPIDVSLWEPILRKEYSELPAQEEQVSALMGEVQFSNTVTYEDFVKQITELKQFSPRVYGIGDTYLKQHNQTHSHQVDPEKFRCGEVCLINFGTDVYESMIGKEIDVKSQVTGKEITLTIGGIWESPITGRTADTNNGYVAGIYVSDECMKFLDSSAGTDLFCVNVKAENESAVKAKLEAIEKENLDAFHLSCKSDSRKTEQTTISTMQVLGEGLSILLLLIGLLNFINTLFSGVISRQREFAVMESIGMTKRQLFHMMMWEGAISALLSSVIGLAASVIIYFILDKAVSSIIKYAAFSFPVFSAVGFVFILFTLCLTAAYIMYRYSSRNSVAQQLRDTLE